MSEFHLRHMYSRDLSAVERIDQASFDTPLPMQTLSNFANSKRYIAHVLQVGVPKNGLFTDIAGFYVYRRVEETLQILRFAIDPEFRRWGLGRQMMRFILDHASAGEVVRCDVSERWLTAQQFLREMKLKCVETVPGGYQPSGDDAYVFSTAAIAEPPHGTFSEAYG